MADTFSSANDFDQGSILPENNTSSPIVGELTQWVKPQIDAPDINQFPAELMLIALWILWAYMPSRNGGKPRKIPMQLIEGRLVPSDATSPKGWAPFEKVLNDFNHSGASGIGFCFSADNDILGIDVDGVFKRDEDGTIVLVDGEKGDIANEILEKFKGLGPIELSVSKTGFHIIVRGQWNGGWSKAPGHNFIECYDRDRYFAMSGALIPGYTAGTLSNAQDELDWLANRFPKKTSSQSFSDDNNVTINDEAEIDPEVLQKALDWLSEADGGAYWRSYGEAPARGLFRDEGWREPFDSASDLDWRVIQKLAWLLVLNLRVDDDLVGAYLLVAYRKWPGNRGEDGERKARYAIAKALDSAFNKRAEEQNAGTWERQSTPLSAEQFEAIARSEAPPPIEEEPINTPAPFRGAMANIVAHTLATSTKPQPELALLSAIIAMASCCPGAYYLRMGGMRLNLYGLGIGESGCGKDNPRVVAAAIVREAGGRVLAKPASGQGLEDELISKTPMLLEIDEGAHMFQELNGKDASTGTVALARLILMLFSGSRGTYSTRAKAKGQNKGHSGVRDLANPTLNMLAFSTPSKLSEVLSTSNIEDGLLGRFLYAAGRERVKPAFVENHEIPESIKDLAGRVRRAGAMPNVATGGTIYLSNTEITESVEARVRLSTLMVEASSKGDDAKDPLTQTLLTRSFEKMYRLAGVLAVWVNPSMPVIEVEHVDWAYKYVSASDETIIRFCGGHLHGDQTRADASKVHNILRAVVSGKRLPTKRRDLELTKGCTTTRSFVLWASRLSKKPFDEAVAHLVDSGTVIEAVVERRDAMTGRSINTKLLSLDVED